MNPMPLQRYTRSGSTPLFVFLFKLATAVPMKRFYVIFSCGME
jgi:hypothetical protein